MRVIFLVVLTLASQCLYSQSYEKVLKHLDSDPSFTKSLESCPSTLFQDRNEDDGIHFKYCAENPAVCLKNCEAGDSGYCYSLGYVMQQDYFDEKYAEFLFAKSCQLGNTSGCTNRASGMIKYLGDSALDCAIQTFELTCANEDAWGCTMLGAYLAQGKGIERDFQRALTVLKVGCKNGIEDPACQYSRSISGQIEAVLNKE